MRLAQITDTHLFDRAEGTLYGMNTADSLGAVVEHLRARALPLDAILVTGDLSHDGGTPAYRRLIKLLAPLAAPLYCLPGNHDALQIFACVLKGARVHSGGRLRAGGWQLLFLDSAVLGSEHGQLRPAELARLDGALCEHPERPALVCLHHPPVPVGSAWLDRLGLDNAEALFAVLDRHPQVRGVLSGHVHQAYDTQRNGVRLLTTPSTCIQFKPGCADFAVDDLPPGYRWLELHDDGRIDTGVVHLPVP
ncbi:MAG: 3',5'-cyclic-AMP phosphodiesterase [Gammaproteobacteria bacterium]